jgi:hypothetical protein
MPDDYDLDAKAAAALDEARELPPGPERTEALKRAGLLRNAADVFLQWRLFNAHAFRQGPLLRVDRK